VTSGSVATPSGRLSVQWAVRNNGPATTPRQWTDRFVLSDKGTWAEVQNDPSSHYHSVLQTTAAGIGVGAEQSFTAEIPIPPGIDADGDHQAYLYVFADSGNHTDETDETNNVAARVGFIRIGSHDLELTDRIEVFYRTDDEMLRRAVEEHVDYIRAETLCDRLEPEPTAGGKEIKLSGRAISLLVRSRS